MNEEREQYMDDEDCWCGSGKQFSECHKHRKNEMPLPEGALRSRFNKFFDKPICLHPDADKSKCGKPIAAHTIQRRGALNSISDGTGHVLSFYPHEYKDGKLMLQKIGLKKASTFRGFCDKHDSGLFAPIELTPFVGSEEQCFLVGFRALCHELYQKQAVVSAIPDMKSVIDRGRSYEEQVEIQNYYGVSGAGVSKGAEDASKHKGLFDTAWRNKDYKEWKSVTIEFEGKMSVLSTGAPTPTFDVFENSLQNLHDTFRDVQPLYYGTLPNTNGGSITFTWHKTDDAPQRFIDSVLQLPPDYIPSAIVQFMFSHVENTYFSDEWWNGLDISDRSRITELASITNPYYTYIDYLHRISVPWSITTITRSN